jgi:hypothetical protein
MGTGRKTFAAFTGALLVLTLFTECYKEILPQEEGEPEDLQPVLYLNEVGGFLDDSARLVMFTLPQDTVMAYSPLVHHPGYESMWLRGRDLGHNEVINLGEVVVNHPYILLGRSGQKTDSFQLVFTTLPLVRVTVSGEIPDEPKSLSRMEVQFCNPEAGNDGVQMFESVTGIEIRGGSSTRYDKKSYGIELWEDESGNDYPASLLGMRHGEDWILDAMWVDRLRMRNKLSFELWKQIGRIPEGDGRDALFPGIEGRYVELFINQSYAGVYLLTEKLDEHLLQFTRDQHDAGGVIYKAIEWANGSTRFDSCCTEPPDQPVWDGWELIYPKEPYAWDPLDTLRHFVASSNDETFASEIADWIDLENAVDYYLFINLLSAWDNTGKNTFLVRYTDISPFFILPWDVEASWGRMWDGANSNPWGMITNRLFDRLIETDAGGFNEKLEETWEAYRSDVFSMGSLTGLINRNYGLLVSSGAIERENWRWEEAMIDLDQEYDYIGDWLQKRIDYLDQHFD